MGCTRNIIEGTSNSVRTINLENVDIFRDQIVQTRLGDVMKVGLPGIERPKGMLCRMMSEKMSNRRETLV